MNLRNSNKKVLVKKQYKKIYYNNNGRPCITYGGKISDLEDVFDKIDEEEKLACFVQSDKNVMRFAFKIMYNTIKKAINLRLDENVIIKAISEDTLDDNNPDIIKKPGFPINEAHMIIDLIREKDEDDVFAELLEMKKLKFHHIMGSFYYFTTNTDFIFGILEESAETRKILMDTIKKMFCLPNDVTWDIIKHLLINDNKRLYLDAFAYASNCSQSLYRRHLLNYPYIRKKVYELKTTQPSQCHTHMVNKENSKIALGNSWYVVQEDSFFAEILKIYGRKYIAGPSGSAVLIYIMVFTLLNFEKTEINKILLLSCIIGDYIPYYHSLTEILMTYTFEIDKNYNISIDPVTFVKTLIKPCLDNLKSQDTHDTYEDDLPRGPVGGARTKMREPWIGERKKRETREKINALERGERKKRETREKINALGRGERKKRENKRA